MRVLAVIALVGCAGHGQTGEVCGETTHEWSFALPLQSHSIRLVSGDTVVAGTFGSLDLDDGFIHNSIGPNNLYIATFDPAGVLEGLRRFVADQSLDAITAADDGGLVLAGTFTGEIDFGGGPLTATAERDMYVARLAADGRLAFARTFPGASPVSVALSPDGNVAIAGRHAASIDLGSGVLPGPAQFLLVLDPSGDHVLDRSLAAGAEQTSVAVRYAGSDLIVAGSYSFAIDLGGGPLTSAGGTDLYIARLARDGSHLASRSFGGPGNEGSQAFDGDRVSLAVATNQLVIAGSFEDAIDFGDGLHEAADVAKDAFVVALDTDLALRWARVFPNVGFQAIGAIDADADGAVAVTGISDSGTIVGQPLACGGEPDAEGRRASHMFAAVIGRNGVLEWTRCFAATAFGAGTEVSYQDGELALGGILDGELDLAGVSLVQPGMIGGFTATVRPQCE